MAPDLGNTQKWMQAVILHPGSDREAVASPRARKLVPASEFPRLIRPSRTLDSFDRIGIYRGMYLSRLQEALEADYPGLAHFLGPKRFSDLVTGYVDRYPSQSYTLNRLGDRLPEYIRSRPGIVRQDFLYELARFELLMSRLFDAEESPVLTPEAIAAVPPESWETARLKPVAALAVQALRYPVGGLPRGGAPGQSKARHPAQKPLGGGLSTPIRTSLAGSVPSRLSAAGCSGQWRAAGRSIEPGLERRAPAGWRGAALFLVPRLGDRRTVSGG